VKNFILWSFLVYWLVAPVLPYELIEYCAEHDVFINQDGVWIDSKTGAEMDEVCSHGRFWGYILFDEANGRLGIYSGDEAGEMLEFLTPDEFFWLYPHLENTLNAYKSLNTKMFALAVGSGFITDFIFEHAVVINEHSVFAKVNGRYGILNIFPQAGSRHTPDSFGSVPFR